MIVSVVVVIWGDKYAFRQSEGDEGVGFNEHYQKCCCSDKAQSACKVVKIKMKANKVNRKTNKGIEL